MLSARGTSAAHAGERRGLAVDLLEVGKRASCMPRACVAVLCNRTFRLLYASVTWWVELESKIPGNKEQQQAAVRVELQVYGVARRKEKHTTPYPEKRAPQESSVACARGQRRGKKARPLLRTGCNGSLPPQILSRNRKQSGACSVMRTNTYDKSSVSFIKNRTIPISF